MGVSMLTVLEIYGNQSDIVCECLGKNNEGLFIGVIRRGPGHNGKLLLEAGFSDVVSEEEAVLRMESLRDSIVAYAKKELEDEKSQISKLLKDDSAQLALEVARMARKGIESC